MLAVNAPVKEGSEQLLIVFSLMIPLKILYNDPQNPILIIQVPTVGTAESAGEHDPLFDGRGSRSEKQLGTKSFRVQGLGFRD